MLNLWIFRDEDGNELGRTENAYPPPPAEKLSSPMPVGKVLISDYRQMGQAARDALTAWGTHHPMRSFTVQRLGSGSVSQYRARFGHPIKSEPTSALIATEPHP